MSRGQPPGIRITQRDLAEGTEVDFTDEQEYWNTYKLSDGTTLKVKLVLNGVKRLKKCNPDGMPIYLIRSQNIVRTIDVPAKLKAKPKESTFKPV
ncbi:hypothetical protein KAU88_09100 [Candidatus Bathyarchaeota archaeon]|nr:hypothetical protein [Candidatus Bathyarchaeota archaeon]